MNHVSLSQALVPSLLGPRARHIGWELGAAMAGLVTLTLLARIAVPLPWTPVPITGQTFGVALLSMLFGLRALPIVMGYMALGASGLPVFAAGAAGLVWGPTLGYLIGMMLASALIGTLADRGWTRTLPRAWLAGFGGSCLTFAAGLTVLDHFVPAGTLLAAGLWPFIPGDLIKTTAAAVIATGMAKRFLN